MLYNTLLNYDCSQVYNNTSVDAAVNGLNTAMHFAMDQSIRCFLLEKPNSLVSFLHP
jgi:hypothetical protein